MSIARSEQSPDVSISTEITAGQLFDRVSQDNDLLLLDVRNDQEFSTWRIEGRHTPTTLHLPYVAFIEEEEDSIQQVPVDHPIVVVCAKGGASDYVAQILRARGYQAANLVGGMIAWGNHYAIHPIIESGETAIYQVDRVARGCLSYILLSRGSAVVIDPVRHADVYLSFLNEHSARLELVLDTHAHADHISSGPALAAASGAPYYLHPYDGIHPFDMLPARLEYEMLKDGMLFQVGSLSIQALHVPGHTLGLVNFLVQIGGGEQYLFTGDSIFLNSFGRPDLGGQGQAWAGLVYESIYEKIRTQVPQDAWVLPGHYAQAGESREDGAFIKRLGDLYRENPDLCIPKDEFIQYVLDHLPVMPQQYIQIKRVNAGLAQPAEEEANELELGKNVCALSTAYSSA